MKNGTPNVLDTHLVAGCAEWEQPNGTSGKPDEALQALEHAKKMKTGQESFSEEEWKAYHQQAIEAVAWLNSY